MKATLAMLSMQSMVYAQMNGAPGVVSKTNIFKTINAPRVEPPTAHYTYKNITAEEETRIRSVGLLAVPGVKHLFEGSPAFKDLSTVYGLEPIFGRFRPGSVGPDGYLAYMYAVKGLRILSAVSTQYRPSSTMIVLASQKAECEDDSIEVEMNRVAGKVKVEKPIGDDTKMTFFSAESELLVYGVPWTDKKNMETGNFLTLAKVETEYRGPGILFPYFNGMLTPDRDTTAHVFFLLFSKSIGEDNSIVDDVLSRIRKGLRELATTRAGMFLSHAYFGAELATRNGLMIQFLVDDSSYHGFILSGSNLRSVTFHRKQYRVGTEEEIKETVRGLNKHKAALVRILAIVKSVVGIDGAPIWDVSMETFSTSRRLYKFITSTLDRQMLTEEQDTGLFTLLQDISYGDVFPVPTVALVKVALRVMAGETVDILDEYPAYLRADYPKNNDNISIALSLFGEKAPAMSYGNPKECMTFDIPSMRTEQDPNLSLVNEKRVLQYIPFQMVSVKAAVINYQTLFAQSKLRIPGPRARRDEFSNSSLYSFTAAGQKDFVDVYNRVKAICDQFRAANRVGESARKRKRAEDGDKEPSVKKTKIMSSYL